jgi:hypothetical protein
MFVGQWPFTTLYFLLNLPMGPINECFSLASLSSKLY